ncbi:hypothetical protein C8R45DRAFT_1188657, partial [Mycena sanguinolenta]
FLLHHDPRCAGPLPNRHATEVEFSTVLSVAFLSLRFPMATSFPPIWLAGGLPGESRSRDTFGGFGRAPQRACNGLGPNTAGATLVARPRPHWNAIAALTSVSTLPISLTTCFRATTAIRVLDHHPPAMCSTPSHPISRVPAAVHCDMPLSTSSPRTRHFCAKSHTRHAIHTTFVASFTCLAQLGRFRIGWDSYLGFHSSAELGICIKCASRRRSLELTEFSHAPSLLLRFPCRAYPTSRAKNAVSAISCDSSRSRAVPSPVRQWFTLTSRHIRYAPYKALLAARARNTRLYGPTRRLLSSHWRDRRVHPDSHSSSSPPMAFQYIVRRTSTSPEISRRKNIHVQLAEDVSLWILLKSNPHKRAFCFTGALDVIRQYMYADTTVRRQITAALLYDLPEKLTKSKLKKLSAALLSLLVGHVDRKRVSAALFAARDIVCGAKGRIVKSAWILRRKQR